MNWLTCKRQPRRGCFVVSAVTISIVVLTVLSHSIWLPELYTYLDVSQPPQKADIIIVLGGDKHGHRARYGATLYQQAYAGTILVSGHADYVDDDVDLIAKQDVPVQAIVVNARATSTYDEAHQIRELLITMDVKSALIVTNRYHTRRATATYYHAFEDQDITLTFVSPEDGIEASSWWQSNHKIPRSIVMEYPKMFYYWLAYGIVSG